MDSYELQNFLAWIGAIYEAAQRGYGAQGVIVDIYPAAFGDGTPDKEYGLRIRLIGKRDPPKTASVEREFPSELLHSFAGSALDLLTMRVEEMGKALARAEQ